MKKIVLVFVVFFGLQLSCLSAARIIPKLPETPKTQTNTSKNINVPPQFFAVSPEKADITFGYKNNAGQAWRVSDDHKNLMHNVAGAKKDSIQWETIPAQDNNGQTISPLKTIKMSLDCGIMLLQDTAGTVYRYDWDKSSFTKLATSYAYTHKPEDNTYVKTTQPLHIEDISIGNAQSIWTLDKDNQIIYQLNTTNGLWFPRANGISVSAGIDGAVLTLDTKGIAHVYVGRNQWQPLPGVVLDKVAMCSKNYIYGISGGNLWRYDRIKKSWKQVMGADNNPVSGVKNIGINPMGAMFLTGDDGTVYSNGKHVVSIHQQVLKALKTQQQKTTGEKKASQSISRTKSKTKTAPTKNEALKLRKTHKTKVKAPSDDNPAE